MAAARGGRGLAGALLLGFACPALGFEAPEDLPEGEGREETFYTCSACHSFNLVARQGMSRGLWEDTVTLMVETHGMPELPPEDRELIVSYLAGAFPPPKAPGGWTNPFLDR